VPSTILRGKLEFAISTDGASPALAKRIGKELAETYPEWYGKYVNALGRVRSALREKIADSAKRAEALRHIASQESAAALSEMDEDSIYKKLIEDAMNFSEA
ncbi:MAG: hypothetical protein JXR97_02980, partial [Planctomycetes bacterium]|nr:hypothetical protein [Planctomycetota bacterium]